jgi:hypothetical protein
MFGTVGDQRSLRESIRRRSCHGWTSIRPGWKLTTRRGASAVGGFNEMLPARALRRIASTGKRIEAADGTRDTGRFCHLMAAGAITGPIAGETVTTMATLRCPAARSQVPGRARLTEADDC